MGHGKPIEHTGIIKEVKNGFIKVHLMDDSLCSECHAQDSCVLSQREDKIIEISIDSRKFQVGETIIVTNEPSLGSKAIFLSYVLPLIFVIVTLFIAAAITGSETTAGIISILVLIPYYFCLYLFREKLKRTFEFKIKTP